MNSPIKLANSKSLQSRCHRVIPGGAHTYAKGDDQYPEEAPPFLERGLGCHVWDTDGNRFIEYGMGLRAITLGHAYSPILEAAYKQMCLGSNFTRPSPLELDCAESLLDLIGFDGMVKFGKNGSDATSAAVRLSRAYTQRDIVGICADHPFFSVDDWFMGSTAMHAGIPKATQSLTVRFNYNDIDSVKAIFEKHPREIACLILEPAAAVEPENDFLHRARELCHRNGALLIFDEMITGFRWPTNCAQRYYGVQPDLSTFGKALGNGYSVSALVGRKEVMELGGLQHDRERVFLLSLTHGAELHCLAAALEVMKIYRRENIVDQLQAQGEKLVSGIQAEIRRQQLGDYFQLIGRPSNLIYVTNGPDRERSQLYRTLFLQETLKRGIIMPSLVVSRSHSDEVINLTVEVIGEALEVYRKALNDGVDGYLTGRPVKPVFRQFN